MKLFIAALCTIIIIAAFCAIGTVKSIDIIDGLLTELQGLPQDGEVPNNAKEVSEKLLTKWEDDFFIISILHPHQHLDEVKEKLINLDSYSGTDEYAEWKQAHASLEESLTHLKGLLEANLDNIM